MFTSLWEGRKRVLEMGKRHCHLVIPEEIVRALMVFITNKQEGQFKKGDISKWVGIAINNLTAGYSAHTQNTQNTNPYQIPKGRLKVKNLMQDICNQLIQSGLRVAPINPGSTIPIKHLQQMIKDVTGHHDEKRTIKNYIENLVKYGYLADKGYTGALMIVDTGTDIEYIERVMEQQKQDERNKKQEQAESKKEFDTIMENLK